MVEGDDILKKIEAAGSRSGQPGHNFTIQKSGEIEVSKKKGMDIDKKADDDQLDSDLKELGELQLDENGHIEYDQFLKILKMGYFYGRTQFNDRKHELVQRRREALKNKDQREYEKILNMITQEEEICVSKKLREIFNQLNISDQEFV